MSASVTQELDRQALGILQANDRGTYTVPTNGLYPYQWNWDSAFAALGFASFNIDRAWTELETLMSAQWPNGMVPHIVFHQRDDSYFPGPEEWGTGADPASSGITQPPVAASVARMIYERNPEQGRARLDALFPKLLAWHGWFMKSRCESGAAAVTHPWEAGRDNAPDWDDALANVDGSEVKPFNRRDLQHVDPHMRPTKADYEKYMALVEFGRNCGWDDGEVTARGPFRVADPTTTFILLRANRDLLVIAEALGKPGGEIRNWIAALTDGARALWNSDTGSFDSLNLRTGEHSGSLSSASFLCWYAGIDSGEMLEKFNRVSGSARFGVPSYDPECRKFDRKRYWRGPAWAFMNLLIAKGLRDFGFGDLAGKVRSDTRSLIESGGFAEYFDPTDGEPAGGGLFTWTAAVWLAWASPAAEGEDQWVQ